ncbi:MAG: ABC transporter substrate-binding protein [Myxococcota bacterium]
MRRTLALGACAVLMAAGAAASAVHAAEAAPEVAPVERLHAALIDVMQHADALQDAGRRETLTPVLDSSFDLTNMAARSLGRHWKKLQTEERRRFVRAFRELTISTYAARFDGYSGEEFETLSVEPSIRETRIVHTVLHTSDDDIRLDYRVHATRSGYRIIDVYLNGTVSEIALRRSEYTSKLKRDGFEALVSALESKAAPESS